MVRLALALLGALLTGTAGAADDALAGAEQAWRYGDVQAATERLRTVLQAAPDDAEARLLLARVLLDDGRNESAAALLRDRDDPKARAVLAAARLEQGDTEAVLRLTETVPAGADARVRAWLLTSRGQALTALGTLGAAERALQDATAADPDSARPLVGLAELARRRGEPDAAAALLQQATEARSDLAQAWSALGDDAWRQGDFAAAQRAYSAALTWARSTWALRYRRALAALELGDAASAQQDIDSVRRDVPGFAGIDYVVGRLRLAAGAPAEALRHLRAFLEQQPAAASARYYAAVANWQLGQDAAAESLLAGLRKARPQDPQVAALLAELWLARGDHAAVEQLLAPFVAEPTPAPELLTLYTQARHAQGRALGGALAAGDSDQGAAAPMAADAVIAEALLRARRLQAEGRSEAAVAAVRDLIEQYPQAARARTRLVELLLKAGDLEAAEAAAQDFVTALPEAPLAYAVRAVVQAAQGNTDGARLDLGGALDLAPDYADAALGLAVLHAGAERLGAARQTLEELLQRDPSNAAALLLLAKLEGADAGEAAALERLRAGVAASPQTLAIRALLARALLARGQPSEALLLIQEAPPETPQPGRLLLEAEALLALDRALPAVASLRKVAELVPDSAAVRFALAGARVQVGQLDEARGALLTGLGLPGAERLTVAQLDAMLARLGSDTERQRWLTDAAATAPEHPAVLEAAARFALYRGEPGAAAAAYERLLQSQPQRARYLVGLARARHTEGRRDEALAILEDAAAAGSADTETYLLLGALALGRQDRAAAMAAYREALARTPGQPLAANNLAVLLVEDDPREALRLAKLAERASPHDPEIQDTLGVALLAVGEAKAARRVLARAAQASPNPTIAYHYARALVAVAEPAAAARRLLPLLGQDFPEAAQARRLHAKLTAAP